LKNAANSLHVRDSSTTQTTSTNTGFI